MRQGEPVINQTGSPGEGSGRLSRSAVWGVLLFGTEDPDFKFRWSAKEFTG